MRSHSLVRLTKTDVHFRSVYLSLSGCENCAENRCGPAGLPVDSSKIVLLSLRFLQAYHGLSVGRFGLGPVQPGLLTLAPASPHNQKHHCILDSNLVKAQEACANKPDLTGLDRLILAYTSLLSKPGSNSLEKRKTSNLSGPHSDIRGRCD